MQPEQDYKYMSGWYMSNIILSIRSKIGNKPYRSVPANQPAFNFPFHGDIVWYKPIYHMVYKYPMNPISINMRFKSLNQNFKIFTYFVQGIESQLC